QRRQDDGVVRAANACPVCGDRFGRQHRPTIDMARAVKRVSRDKRNVSTVTECCMELQHRLATGWLAERSRSRPSLESDSQQLSSTESRAARQYSHGWLPMVQCVHRASHI